VISRRRQYPPTEEFVSPSTLRRLSAPFLTLALCGFALAACDGTNAFTPRNPGGGPDDDEPDETPPAVSIQFPTSGNTTVAVADSIFVRADVSDDVALARVDFEGFALRGDPELGTQQRFARFVTKTVSFPASRAVEDTTLSRYLVAVEDDSTAERNVMIVVTAVDTAGNVSADTSLVNIGGPRVSIASPAPGTDFRGGTEIRVRLQAEDRVDLLRSVRLRASGAFAFDTTLTLANSPEAVDSVVVIPIPQVTGALTLEATAVSGSNITGNSRPVEVDILPAEQDQIPPRVTFQFQARARSEIDDSVTVIVSATDEIRVASVGATILAIHRRPGAAPDTLAVLHRRTAGSLDTMTFRLSEIPLPQLDTMTLSLEVTAYGLDSSNNCGAATAPNVPQQQPCRNGPSGSRLADVPGRLFNSFIARGVTINFPNGDDVLADLVADSQRVYLSNFSSNRVEVLPLGSLSYGTPVAVGSEPWGLALGRTRDSLYVANSGGTNISVVPLRSSPLREAQDRRIFTRNERLFSVEYRGEEVQKVVLYDYSDRPQFIAQASNGLLVYSTKPTPADTNGTVRIYDPRKLRSEIFIGYVDRHTPERAVVVNADSAFHVDGPDYVMVCPRRRFGDSADPGFCVTGDPFFVADSLTRMRAAAPNAAGGRWDTRLDIGSDIEEVGFADTTFVAASGNRDYIAVGEGVRQNARIPLFNAPAGGDSLVLVGDVRDLISNTAERVIGLGLNFDGSLGIARGNLAYLFTSTARLQGVVPSGSPSGGVAIHPDNRNYPSGPQRLALVSGIQNGRPYVDVINTFSFTFIKRVFIRDPVVGALAVAPRVDGDPANVVFRIYALTSEGVLALQITSQDLVP
jgi:hypothetical protein